MFNFAKYTHLFSLKDDNTIRKSMLKLVRMVQKLKNDK